MAKIVWTLSAADDLEEIVQYIAADKPEAASGLAAKILDSIEQLADFPLKGRIVPELQNQRYREVIVPPCRIMYTLSADAVLILRIIRGERHVDQDLFSAN